MRPKILRLAALATGVLLAGGMIAGAQDFSSVHYRSLEARVAQSPSVVHGTITNVSGTALHPGEEHAAYSYTILVKVEEVLKGNIDRKELKFSINGFQRWRDLERWGDEQASFLWFLDETGRMGDHDMEANEDRWIYLGPTVPGKAAGDTRNLDPIYSMDMTHLTDAKEILTRARAFAAGRFEVTKFESFNLAEVTKMLGPSPVNNLGAWLEVPVAPPLEPLARRLVETPEDFVFAQGNKSDLQVLSLLREDGMKALGHFKTAANIALVEKTALHLIAAPRDFVPADAAPDAAALSELRLQGIGDLRDYKTAENIKLLKSLLSDPEVTHPGNTRDKYYLVRARAYDVLKAWGVDVPEPVTVEKVPADDHG